MANNCWNCEWNRLGGNTLMGVCWWFVESLGYAREIPRTTCDKGCKFWSDADIDFDKIKKFLKSEKQIMEDKKNGTGTLP